MAICTPFILLVRDSVYCLFGQPAGLAKTCGRYFTLFMYGRFHFVILTASGLSDIRGRYGIGLLKKMFRRLIKSV